MPITYNLDTTGLFPANKITDEQHVLTVVNTHPQRLIIPLLAPFSIYNLAVKHVDALGNISVLQENIDYYLALPYIQATRSLQFIVYGAISINNINLSGTILLDYQTIGGDTITDPQYILDRLAELVYNPRTTVWDAVTNKPCVFPPTDHIEDMDYLYGHQELINSINTIGDRIAESTPTNSGYFPHLININNPHLTTSAQVGLGNVANLELATITDVDSRAEVNKYVTLGQVIRLIRNYNLI